MFAAFPSPLAMPSSPAWTADKTETPIERSSSAAAGVADGRPRTRQRIYRPPPALAVPHIEQDAAERKRVLNVLAQRRYRKWTSRP